MIVKKTRALGPTEKGTEGGLTKNEIIATLFRSPHGKLSEYVPTGLKAATEQAEFTAHLIGYNALKGQIRDARVALPVVTLAAPEFPEELVENSLAHLASLDPRNLLRAVRFALELRPKGRMRMIRRLVERYLRAKESNWAKWERMAVQHRASVKELYALFSVKPSEPANNVLFKKLWPAGSIFGVIANLKNMGAEEAAGTIMEWKIPFLIAEGALGKKAKDPTLVLALMGRMTASELVNNSKKLEAWGVKTNPALRAAYEEGLAKAAKSTKNTLKATKAVEAVEDEGLKAKLQSLQEAQIKKVSVDGSWLVLGDKSGSMKVAIEASRHVSATLAKMVSGDVHLMYFDTTPRYISVTGKDYDAILKETKLVKAEGGTSIGCGVRAAIDKKLDLDGIAIVTDGGEQSTPHFRDEYKKYAATFDKEPTVYIYATQGYDKRFTEGLKSAGIDAQVFDIPAGFDYYSLPAMVSTMRVERYSLVDEIMSTRLLTLDDVLGPVRELVTA